MKTMTIERLLNWAFTEELCKISFANAAGKLSSVESAWSKVSQFGELGTLIDLSPNRFGVIPDFSSDTAPHPDSLIIGEAVRDLADMKFDIPDGWQPFPDWDDPRGTVAEASALILDDIRAKSDVLQGRHVVSLVTTAAVLRRGPDWEAEKPREQIKKIGRRELWFLHVRQKDSFGKMITVEVDGYDAKSKRPKAGAFQKYELEWSIRGAVLDRLDWQLWQDALAVLHGRLKDNLAGHALLDFQPRRQPWMHGASCAAGKGAERVVD